MTLNQGWIYRDQVQPREAGQSLLDYYSQRYRHSDRQTWRDRIVAGQIQVEGRSASPDWVLEAGQRLTYHRPPWAEPMVPLHVEVLYADDDVVVVNKPSGLPVLPGGGFVAHTLLHLLQQRYPQNPPVPLHRLGRGTSGLVLLGRSPLAKTVLSQQLRATTAGQSAAVEKTYRALVGSCPLPETFTLTTPIGKLPHPTLGYLYGASPTGKPAHSEGRVLERRGDRALLAVKILTGRPHQIRIHLAAAGCPLLGDPLYGVGGGPKVEAVGITPGDGGYHLHAHGLRFRHPRTHEPLTLTAPLPPPLRTSAE
jgi:23S rRNA pseudouridine1911/1915/1917 synthase